MPGSVCSSHSTVRGLGAGTGLLGGALLGAAGGARAGGAALEPPAAICAGSSATGIVKGATPFSSSLLVSKLAADGSRGGGSAGAWMVLPRAAGITVRPAAREVSSGEVPAAMVPTRRHRRRKAATTKLGCASGTAAAITSRTRAAALPGRIHWLPYLFLERCHEIDHAADHSQCHRLSGERLQKQQLLHRGSRGAHRGSAKRVVGFAPSHHHHSAAENCRELEEARDPTTATWEPE